MDYQCQVLYVFYAECYNRNNVFLCALSDHNSYIGETWLPTASGADLYPELPHPSDPQLDLSELVSLETDSGGEEGREETIVYL